MELHDQPRSRSNAQQQQYAALPFVQVQDQINILLLTSRETRRWVIPKGWPIRGLAGNEVAEREAVEEAGVIGEAIKKPLGHYSYRKKLHFFSSVDCRVEVFALRVEQQKLNWRERSQRQLAWFPALEAAELVHEKELAQLIRDLRLQNLPSQDLAASVL